MRKLCPSKAEDNEHVQSALLGLAGDAHLMLVHQRHQGEALAAHRDNMESHLEEDASISNSALTEVTDFGMYMLTLIHFVSNITY